MIPQMWRQKDSHVFKHQWLLTMALLKISTDEQNEGELKICLITTTPITIPPYHISLWNPSGQNLILKWNITTVYVKESDYKEKDPPEQLRIQGKPLQHNPQNIYCHRRESHRNFTWETAPLCQKSQHLCSTTISIWNNK